MIAQDFYREGEHDAGGKGGRGEGGEGARARARCDLGVVSVVADDERELHALGALRDIRLVAYVCVCVCVCVHQ